MGKDWILLVVQLVQRVSTTKLVSSSYDAFIFFGSQACPTTHSSTMAVMPLSAIHLWVLTHRGNTATSWKVTPVMPLRSRAFQAPCHQWWPPSWGHRSSWGTSGPERNVGVYFGTLDEHAPSTTHHVRGYCSSHEARTCCRNPFPCNSVIASSTKLSPQRSK